MHDIRYDEIHDEILVGNPFGQAILVFRGAAAGDEGPIRMIQGPKTLLGTPDNVEVDPVNNEIYVPENDRVLVFPRDAKGDVAPLRVLMGRDSKPGWRTGSVAVDPTNNVLVAAGSYGDGRDRQPALVIFDRTAQGTAKPRAVISGPNTGLIQTRQIQVYRGWILVTQITSGEEVEPENAFVGIWSVNDDGDVPPRWRIDAKPGNIMKKPRGIVINPKNKEVIVSDMRLNAVLTFSLPEMFETKP